MVCVVLFLLSFGRVRGIESQSTRGSYKQFAAPPPRGSSPHYCAVDDLTGVRRLGQLSSSGQCGSIDR